MNKKLIEIKFFCRILWTRKRSCMKTLFICDDKVDQKSFNNEFFESSLKTYEILCDVAKLWSQKRLKASVNYVKVAFRCLNKSNVMEMKLANVSNTKLAIRFSECSREWK